MNQFTIQSTESSSSITLSNRDGEFFVLEIETSDLAAKKRVSTYTDEYGIYNLFKNASAHNPPWLAPYVWESLEGELTIEISCTSTGSVNICIKIDTHYYTPHIITPYVWDFGYEANSSPETKISGFSHTTITPYKT